MVGVCRVCIIPGTRAILGDGISGMAGMVLLGTMAGTTAGITACTAGATGTAGHIVPGASAGAAIGATVLGITGGMDTITMDGTVAGIMADMVVGIIQAVAVPQA